MSKELLKFLNGNTDGLFKRYIDKCPDNLNIAWYPSAGQDFRALMYLSPRYAEMNPGSVAEDVFPDLFIFTDYYSSPASFSDKRTRVLIGYCEFLPDLNLPIDDDIVVFSGMGAGRGSVQFLEVSGRSDVLGPFTYPVIYASVENEPFCSKVLLSNNSTISHIIHIRYGGGCGGGGYSSGIWVQNVLKKLNCKVLVTDEHYALQRGDKAAYELYPNLKGEVPRMDTVRTLDEMGWSRHGDVKWNIVRYD